MPDSVEESIEWCVRLTRRTAGNFHYSFLTLPAELYRAMCVLYAFMRVTDDIGDSPAPVETRAAELSQWRTEFNAACRQEHVQHPALPALAALVASRGLPPEHLAAVITGVEMDLQPLEFNTFSELQRYCYHVAGAVGLACIHLWGYHDKRAPAAAIDCGTAFQMTNILRDLQEDAAWGRVYLPAEHLRQFGLSRTEVLAGWPVNDARCQDLLRFEIALTREFYLRAQPLREYLDSAGQPILETMQGIYGGLLQSIARNPQRALRERVSLSRWRKIAIAGTALVKHKFRFWRS